MINANTFYNKGLGIMGKRPKNYRSGIALFITWFKVHPIVCSSLFKKIRGVMPDNFEPKHLLWSLYFLKSYRTTRELASDMKADRGTIMDAWVWPTLDAVARLGLVRHYELSRTNRNSSGPNIVRFAFHG